MNRVMISCGGTGGHTAPGIALAEGLRDRGHVCWLLISNKKVDTRLVEKYSYFEFIRTPGAPFTLHPVGFLRFLYQQVASVFFSIRLIRRLNPDLVVGFGGFSSAGVIVAAGLRKIPFALHESNRIPGRAVRFLSRLRPARVYLPTGVRLQNLQPGRIRFYGCPVRREIQQISKLASRKAMGVNPHCKLLVVLGGSQGATALNEWVDRNLDFFAREGICVYCVIGLDKGEQRVEVRETGGDRKIEFHFIPFTDRVSELLSAADLVVSRAGAGTIAELMRCRAPAILIPYPFSADNHQSANARFFEQQGGGLAIDQEYLKDLHDEVREVIFNDWLLQMFRVNLERMDRENALGRILNDLEHICDDTRKSKAERQVEVLT